MATIIPTVTAENAHVYREQIERIEPFAKRIHIDLMDGVFTPNKSVSPESVWWPEYIRADIHLMHQKPEESLEQLIKLNPALVVIPAESECNFENFGKALNDCGIDFGIALLPETSVDSVSRVLSKVQHMLVFSGNLGHQGGSFANLELLDKVGIAKEINPELEIAWDGGVNDTNVRALIDGGIEAVNVGGYIHANADPAQAFTVLEQFIN